MRIGSVCGMVRTASPEVKALLFGNTQILVFTKNHFTAAEEICTGYKTESFI